MRIVMGILAVIAALAMFTAPADAQGETGRYTMKSIDEGFVRLDTKTGEISTCSKKTGDLVCRAAADDRAVLQAEIDKLQRENERLKSRLVRLEDKTGKKKSHADLPDDEELDRIMGFFEKLVRRFFKFAQSMRDILGEDT